MQLSPHDPEGKDAMDLARLHQTFVDLYGGTPRFFRAPGRVNLIGEHTDYNNGFVLPMTIDRQTVVAARLREDRKIFAHSMNVGQSAHFDLDDPPSCAVSYQEKKFQADWFNYIEGVARLLETNGWRLAGADLLLLSDIPLGAGLSSSAALELSVALALSSLSEHDIDKSDLVKLAQSAEHEFVGTRCGIMDQYVSTFGKPDHALLLDCQNQTDKAIPINTKDLAVIVCDSKVSHKLAASEYNKRRAECERGVELLQAIDPAIKSLRDISPKDFERLATQLPEIIRRRVKHVVTENERTQMAAESLMAGDLQRAGRLMLASHQSLKEDYEVSCRELDLLVEIASDLKGCWGARMTGGGFGGCTVNLVKRDHVDNFKHLLFKKYRQETGIEATINVVESSTGLSELAVDLGTHILNGMHVRKTILPDGRYMIFYEFDDTGIGSSNQATLTSRVG